MRTGEAKRGFALVLTLGLVALLLLAVLALSVIARVQTDVVAATREQTQAKQNALVGLEIALGQLQRAAGPDDVVTGMAGVAGEPTESSLRHWCGVWSGAVAPTWLASGSTGTVRPAITGGRIRLVGSKTVGSPLNQTDQEFVDVGLVELPAIELAGLASVAGRTAYWVGDEGVKVSAIIGDGEVQLSGSSSRPLRPNLRSLVGASFAPSASSNAAYQTLEHLKAGVSGFSLAPAFHAVTRAHSALQATAGAGVPRPAEFVVGAFNLNTSSETAWRSLLEFPDSSDAALALGSSRALSIARGIRDGITARARPFESVAEFIASNLVQDAIDHASPALPGLRQEVLIDEIRPILCTRSDTFRIRAYGDTLDPAEHGTIRSAAYCEALVQRSSVPGPGAVGRRFHVVYFRWLGRDDL